ncbi:MAG: FkbM family methyltransferase [Phycisphaerae bacterium]
MFRKILNWLRGSGSAGGQLRSLAQVRGESPQQTAEAILRFLFEARKGSGGSGDQEKDLQLIRGVFGLSDRLVERVKLLAEMRREPVATAAWRVIRNASFSLIPQSFREWDIPRDLKVTSAERIGNHHARVAVEDGRAFTGYISTSRYQRLHQLCRDLADSHLTPETWEVAVDIVRRYYGMRLPKFLEHLPHAPNIIEAGAYLGYKAVRFADLAGEESKVIAIEMDSGNASLLKENIAQNGLGHRITGIWAGVWKENGSMRSRTVHRAQHWLVGTEETADSARQTDEVPTRTLDSIIEEAGWDRVDFLNIQTNGAEPEALMGLQDHLDRVRLIKPATPYHRQGRSCREIIVEHLEDRGCKVIAHGSGILAVPAPFREEFAEAYPEFR